MRAKILLTHIHKKFFDIKFTKIYIRNVENVS